jgi:glutamyl-tRNA synthetase
MTQNSHIITRFAPSPTGNLHAGNYRTALYSYLYAKKHGGNFVLRIEDTDKERSKAEYKDNILSALSWLGLEYSQSIIQSERADAHKIALEKLIADGHAYISQEEIKKEGDRAEVIRFKNPNRKVKFIDLIRGEIEIDTTDLGDFVIARSLTEPLFHMAIVVDDEFMGVTHIIRGEDHISNTPRHILIQEALGYTTPTYAHLPIVLAKDRTKLSKRKGALPITEYRNRGYLPDAVLNYMALVGWNPGTDQEIFTREELIGAFDLAKVQKSGAIFDDVKLDWVNKEHMNRLSDEAFQTHFENYMTDFLDTPDREKLELIEFKKIAPLLRERLTYFGQIKNMLDDGELDFIFNSPNFENEEICKMLICPEKMWKNGVGEKITVDNQSTKAILSQVRELIATYDGIWDKDTVKALLWPFAEHEGRGVVLWPLRIALSGREKSPDPFLIAQIIGKNEVEKRLTNAISML